MICPKCGSEMSEDSAFCTKCGASLHEQTQQKENTQQNAQNGPQMNQGAYYGQQQNQGAYYGPQGAGAFGYGNPQMNQGAYAQQPYIDPKDHTTEFEAKDVTEHKVFAMLTYLLGAIGVIIALLADKESSYLKFHVKQSANILVLEILVGLITAVLCWTVIVPIAGIICIVILLIVRIICFVNVCGGKSKEPAIVSNFGFLK